MDTQNMLLFYEEIVFGLVVLSFRAIENIESMQLKIHISKVIIQKFDLMSEWIG